MPGMDSGIPRYELDVLHRHRDQPQRQSEDFDCREAQVWLAMNGYLVQKDDGRFAVTTSGVRVLAKCK